MCWPIGDPMRKSQRDPENFGLPYQVHSVWEKAVECAHAREPFELVKDSVLVDRSPPVVLAPSPLRIFERTNVVGGVTNPSREAVHHFPMDFVLTFRQVARTVLFFQGGDPMASKSSLGARKC